MRALVHEESGLAMGFAVIITGVLLLMVMASTAMAHTVQRRTELQAVADNAAYAGALAQADVLSRMAVLNRALAWTYVQANRLHTDYLLRRFAYDGCDAAARACRESAAAGFNEENSLIGRMALSHNWHYNYVQYKNTSVDLHSNAYRNGVYNERLMLGVSGTASNVIGTMSLFKGTYRREVSTNALYQIKDYGVLEERLITANNNIAVINNGLNWLFDNFTGIVRHAVEKSIGDNELPVGSFCLINSGDKSDFFRDFSATVDGEKTFLRRNYHDTNDGTGVDEAWQNSFDWWQSASINGSGVSRTGFRHCLRPLMQLRCKGHHSLWCRVEGFGIVPHDEWVFERTTGTYEVQIGQSFSGTNWASEHIGTATLSDTRFGQCEPARPILLTEKFFGKSGTVVVGVKCPVENPFVEWFGEETRQGFYGSYGATLQGCQMWAVSAARAGVNTNGDKGRYDTTWRQSTEQEWNLHVDDWDAVMLPLARAWYDGRDGKWEKPAGDAACEASDILTAVAGKLSLNAATTTLADAWSGTGIKSDLTKELVH